MLSEGRRQGLLLKLSRRRRRAGDGRRHCSGEAPLMLTLRRACRGARGAYGDRRRAISTTAITEPIIAGGGGGGGGRNIPPLYALICAVHRRAAHARRRGRCRGRDGRVEPAQAGAGARRAALHRRHDARRVQKAHREGRRARAPVPARVRGRAIRRGHHFHFARPARALRGSPRHPHQGRGARRRGRAVVALHRRPSAARTRPSTSWTRPRRACAWRWTRCPPSSTSSSAACASSRSSARR